LGVGEGTAVSWALPTWIESLVLVGALSRLGAVQNPILPIYRHREIGFVTKQTGAKLLIVPSTWKGFDYEGMAREIAAAQPGLDVLIVDRKLPDADPASLAPPLPPPSSPDDAPVRWAFYTSGTTADPKGAQHTDRTIMASAYGMPMARAFPGGGAAKPVQLHYDVKKELGGVGVVSGYGLTECPILAMSTVEDPDVKLAETEGRTTPGVEVKVVKLDESVAKPGEEG